MALALRFLRLAAGEPRAFVKSARQRAADCRIWINLFV